MVRNIHRAREISKRSIPSVLVLRRIRTRTLFSLEYSNCNADMHCVDVLLLCSDTCEILEWFCIHLYWVYLHSATLYKVSMHLTSIFPGYRTCSFQYELSSLGSIRPCCHHDAGNCSNTQVIPVQPGTHSLLGRESAHTGEVSCPRTQRQTPAAETRTHGRPPNPKSQAIVTAP